MQSANYAPTDITAFLAIRDLRKTTMYVTHFCLASIQYVCLSVFQVMYGEGQPGETAPTAGEGGHFGNSRTTAPTDSDLNPSTSAHDQANRPSKAEELLGGEDPMGGAATTREPRHFDDSATTASVKSGVPGQAQTGNTIGSGTHASEQVPPGTATTTAEPHSSSLANKADPRIDSDPDGRRGLEAPSSTTGSGQTSSALPDRTTQR